jgi:hypothetical protein
MGFASSGSSFNVGRRLRARWNASKLTRELAHGADPCASPELSIRAASLTKRHQRRSIAQGLSKVVDDALDPNYQHLTASVPFDAPAVRASQSSLQALAAELHADRAVEPQGVAMAEELLIDYDGPLYTQGEPQALADAARAALAALG